jgi:TPR repeat protein
MKTTSLSIPALLALALKSARSAPALEEAMAAYDRGNYLEAQCLLLLAAHWGNAQAQELLGFMYAIGPALYPGIWRSLGAARNWFERAAEAGRPAAACMHAAFNRHGVLEIQADIMVSFDLSGARSEAWPQVSASNAPALAARGKE